MSLTEPLSNCQATNLYSNDAHRFSGSNDTTCHTLEVSINGELCIEMRRGFCQDIFDEANWLYFVGCKVIQFLRISSLSKRLLR